MLEEEVLWLVLVAYVAAEKPSRWATVVVDLYFFIVRNEEV